ncbi:methionyl-tRNA formyltransferase [bacterium]|nr:methionyl-tRNA formyltransferase [bacterium]
MINCTSLKDKNVYLSMTKDGYLALESLLKHRKKVDVVITRPKEGSGEISDYTDFTPLAKEYCLKVIYTKNINSLKNQFIEERPNILIVNGWSQILTKEILQSSKKGCVGSHPALLPKNRGRAPIPWHFINNEEYGGITIFYLNAEVDDGPIITQKKFKIEPEDNASSYYEKISKFGAELFLKYFDDISSGTAKEYAKPQYSKNATYLLKREPRDSYVNFNKDSQHILNQVRAVTDIYPLAYFFYEDQKYTFKSVVIKDNVPFFSGRNGQIVSVSKKHLGIVSNNKLLYLSKIFSDGLEVDITKAFKQGHQLNEKDVF